MKRSILIAFLLIPALGVDLRGQAPPLTIQHAVQVSFETSPNRYYQLEAAKQVAPTSWATVGPVRLGKGFPLSETVLVSPSAQQLFRTHEYDLTNGLFAYYPLDGSRNDETGISYPIANLTLAYTTNRFGITNRAARLDDGGRYPAQATAILNRNIAGTNDLTISFWFANPRPSAPARLISMNGSRMLLLVSSSSSTNALQLKVATDTTIAFVTKDVGWVARRWYHALLVCSNNVYRFYRDAELLGEGAAVTPPITNEQLYCTIGPDFGVADEARFYNRALTDDEREAICRLEE